MPNWIQNILVVEAQDHQQDEMEEVLNCFREVDDHIIFDFNFILPEPLELPFTSELATESTYPAGTVRDDLPNTDHRVLSVLESRGYQRKYGFDNRRDWREHHWGTKWEGTNPEVFKKDDGLLVVGFNTAWSAPISFYRALVSELGLSVAAASMTEWNANDLTAYGNIPLLNEHIRFDVDGSEGDLYRLVRFDGDTDNDVLTPPSEMEFKFFEPLH